MAVAFSIFLVTVGCGQRIAEIVTLNTPISAADEDCWKNYVEAEYGIAP